VEASAVSDILINELVGDAATELYHQQNENIVVRDAPSVETLLHRLRVIEVTYHLCFK